MAARTNFPGALGGTLFVVLIKHGEQTQEIQSLLHEEWPLLPRPMISRYLQIHKGNGHVNYIEHGQAWVITASGKLRLRRRISEIGWPEWLKRAGYESVWFEKNPVQWKV